jgi:hypothetical protein
MVYLATPRIRVFARAELALDKIVLVLAKTWRSRLSSHERGHRAYDSDREDVRERRFFPGGLPQGVLGMWCRSFLV